MFTRFAVYFTPSGKFADFGSRWLGWDLARGEACAHPDELGLDCAALARRPRRYGFHATIKPPFRLIDGSSLLELDQAVAALCRALDPVLLPELRLARLGRFLALVPQGEQLAVNQLAARVVRDLDRFRRPPEDAELASRLTGNLNAAQRRNLRDWGYPHVMQQFRFHITLTGPLDDTQADQVQAVLGSHLAPLLTNPFAIDSLTLVGEDQNGFFHQIQRYILRS